MLWRIKSSWHLKNNWSWNIRIIANTGNEKRTLSANGRCRFRVVPPWYHHPAVQGTKHITETILLSARIHNNSNHHCKNTTNIAEQSSRGESLSSSLPSSLPSLSSIANRSSSINLHQLLFDALQPVHILLSTIRQFQTGLSRLKSDYLRSIYIQDAEWTHHQLQRKFKYNNYAQQQSQKMQSHISTQSMQIAYSTSNYYRPRRRSQQEHLRALSRDLQTTLPTVIAFVLLPMVGYLFLFLGMMYPRLLLSRQFHTADQRYEFAIFEYAQRIPWYDRLNSNFWGCCQRPMPKRRLLPQLRRVQNGDSWKGKQNKQYNADDSADEENDARIDCRNDAHPMFLESLTYTEMDAAGPVLDQRSLRILYHLCRENIIMGNNTSSIRTTATVTRSNDNDNNPLYVGGRYSIMDKIQSTHLHSMALSNNLASMLALPTIVAHVALQTCIPSFYLKRKLIALAEDIILDDIELIEEGNIHSKCTGLTNEEVWDACWIRSLPMGKFVTVNVDRSVRDYCSYNEDEIQEMRRVLMHHLQMMRSIMAICRVGDPVRGNDSAAMYSKRGLIRDGTLLLLVLHLPAIRYAMKNKSMGCTV